MMWRAVRVSAKLVAAACLALFLALLQKSSGNTMDWPLIPREVKIETAQFKPRGLSVAPPLHFVAAWRLRSDDRTFGGLSAIAKVDGGFLTLSDAGSLIELRPGGAHLESLPKGCASNYDRRERDGESLVLEPNGTIDAGMEYRNAICRIRPDGRIEVTRPAAMRGWPRTGGAESMTRLRNGALLVIAERPRDKGPVSPALLIGEGGRSTSLRYRPPEGYRPTDVAQLPGGALLVLNRKHERPISLPGRLVLIDRFSGGEMSGRTIARLEAPDLDQNFEGVAVSKARGRTYVWLISDDNFMPTQDTILMLFEYRPRERPAN